MAIWQYPFQAVPKKDIQYENGELPSHLKIEKQGEWINIVDPSKFWNNSSLDPIPIINIMDKLLQGESRFNSTDSKSWKGDTENKEDNDCWLSYKNNSVTSFSFRVDMRDLKNLRGFLIPMLEICQQNNLILIGEGQNVIDPEFEEVKPFLIASKAVNFVQDPNGFLENFSKNIKQQEQDKVKTDSKPKKQGILKKLWKK